MPCAHVLDLDGDLDPRPHPRALRDRERESVPKELLASRLEPEGHAARIERRLVRPGVGELEREREIDAREPVRADRPRLRRRRRDHPARLLPRRASLEMKARRTPVRPRARAALAARAAALPVLHAHARVQAHVAVLTTRHPTPRQTFGVGPRLPLRIGVAQSLEVLATLAHTDRVGAEEPDVVAGAAELARPEIARGVLGGAAVHDRIAGSTGA